MTCRRRELAEREEAERREVGERLVEVPDELVQVDRVVVERELELVVIGAERCGDPARVGELAASPVLRKPTENVLTGSAMLRAISATIRLESRPPLSIAPSGTSLMSRSRTDSSSCREQQLLGLLRQAQAAIGAGAGRRPVALDLARVVLDDEPVPGQELRHLARAASAAPGRSRASGRRRSPRSRARRR